VADTRTSDDAQARYAQPASGQGQYATDFYGRLLPQKERPSEALGAVLNSIGLALGLMAIFIVPMLLGGFGMFFAGASLPMARSRRTARQFGIGFLIATAGWLIGMTYAVWRSKALF
jgi:hypothetical protein